MTDREEAVAAITARHEIALRHDREVQSLLPPTNIHPPPLAWERSAMAHFYPDMTAYRSFMDAHAIA